MRLRDLHALLRQLQTDLRAKGFAADVQSSAETHARWCAHTVWPIQLFLEWLNRCPEAAAALAVMLEKTNQKSDSAPAPGNGSVKGANMESRTVTIDNAASVLHGRTFHTREVHDTDVLTLGDPPAAVGLKPVTHDDGTPVTAIARIDGGGQRVEFIEQRGSVILMRLVDAPRKGMIFSGPIVAIEPLMRDEVLASLKTAGRVHALHGVSFNPYADTLDPWAATLDEDAPPAVDVGR